MRYFGQVIRPPSEANSYLLQVTYGCSWNRCTFCPTYLDKPFKVRPVEEVEQDIAMAKSTLNNVKRVFLCDGDAMTLSTSKLMHILGMLNNAFPKLNRVGTYFNAKNILSKSEDEIKHLVENKLTIGYIGLESGSDKVLANINKGSTSGEMIDAVLKAQNCGMKVSVIALLGLGSTSLSNEHAIETAKAITKMNPRYFSLLTLMLVQGTSLAADYANKKFSLPDEKGFLIEVKTIIENVNLDKTIFRTNHASNYLSLEGILSRDKEKLINQITSAIEGHVPLKPEYFRGL